MRTRHATHCPCVCCSSCCVCFYRRLSSCHKHHTAGACNCIRYRFVLNPTPKPSLRTVSRHKTTGEASSKQRHLTRTPGSDFQTLHSLTNHHPMMRCAQFSEPCSKPKKSNQKPGCLSWYNRSGLPPLPLSPPPPLFPTTLRRKSLKRNLSQPAASPPSRPLARNWGSSGSHAPFGGSIRDEGLHTCPQVRRHRVPHSLLM